MKKFSWLLVFVLAICLPSMEALATSGRLKQASIISCNGRSYGHHGDGHWHVARENGYPDGASLGMANPCTKESEEASVGVAEPIAIAPVLSDDASLGRLTIDGEVVAIRDTMVFETNLEEVDVVATANHEHARVVVEASEQLQMGNNQVLILVTAEDGTQREYGLTIRRQNNDTSLKSVTINDEAVQISGGVLLTLPDERFDLNVLAVDERAKVTVVAPKTLAIGENAIQIVVEAEDGSEQVYEFTVFRLSDDTGLTVWINGEQVAFADFKGTVSVDFDIDTLDLSYELADESGSVSVEANQALEVGDNQVVLVVTAENGASQTYAVTVTRSADTIGDMKPFSRIAGLAGLVISAYLILTKRVKP